MPMPGHLSITGEQQGVIEGSCDIEEREGTILVQAFDHTVEIPTDQRGMVAGRRIHRPMMITKETDKSTPMLYQALCEEERLLEVRLDWYRIDDMGSEELYFSILMENAQIARMHPWVPNVLDRRNETLRHMEDVFFIYEKITWLWEPDGIEYEDAWDQMT